MAIDLQVSLLKIKELQEGKVEIGKGNRNILKNVLTHTELGKVSGINSLQWCSLTIDYKPRLLLHTL